MLATAKRYPFTRHPPLICLPLLSKTFVVVVVFQMEKS